MSFVERELEKIEDAIRNTSDRESADALRVVQCALRWATDPDFYMSPSNYMVKFYGLDLPPTNGTGVTLTDPIPVPAIA